MRCRVVVPRAAKAPSTRQALARRSDAITCAPDSCAGPRISAVFPEIRMSAPMRCSSSTCMKRFSNTVSTTLDVPLAWVISAMNWACMSVGNPGCSLVVMSTAVRSVQPSISSVLASGEPMLQPAARIRSITRSRCSRRAPRMVSRPAVSAPATRYVPVSMRSGMMRCSVPCRLGTPSTRMVPVPAPSMRAPILVRRSARSTTSGSRAAFSSTLSPLASTAAMSRSSVPVTVGLRKRMRPPTRPPRGATASM